MEFIYSLFENYGIWVLLCLVFLAQLGIPVGSSFFLMWYGSTLDTTTSLLIVIPVTACAAILGDMTAFSLGKLFSNKFDEAVKTYAWLAKQIDKSHGMLESYGIWIVWFSRFLVTGLGPGISYLLGSRNFPTLKFFSWVVFGEIIFTAEMLYFGYIFKNTWEDLLDFIANAGWLVALVVVSLWIIKSLIKRMRVTNVIR